jgi:uncharacterized membrane protein YeaQ/YmgE (transglycosylase-associated protein family)
MPQGFDLIGWLLVGFFAGVIAGWFVPGRERMGCLATTVLGVVGGLVGGWFWTQVLDQDRAGGFLGALLIAALGSAAVLAVVRGLSRD